VPLAGFWSGKDIALRRRVGTLPRAEARAARQERVRERRLLVERLVREGLLPPGRKPSGARDLCARVHAFLRRTPAALVGLSLDDLAGEVEPVNLPGVGQDRHPSWTRRMRRTLEAIAADPAVLRALALKPRRRQKRGVPKGARRKRQRARSQPGDQGG